METYKKKGLFFIDVFVNGKLKKIMKFATEAERDEFFEEFCVG